jgi:putative ABC transport system permease protein
VNLGLRELRRAPLRFGLLTVAIALLMFLVLFLATLADTLLSFQTGALANSTADVYVYGATARRDLRGSRLDPATAGQVAQVAGVAAAAGIGQTTTTADTGQGQVTLTLFGIRPGGPGTPGNLVRGRLPGAGEAIVDQSDTAAGLTMGGTITLRPGGQRLRIVGYTEGSRFAAGPTAYATLDDWQAAVRAANPGTASIPINLIGVRVKQGKSAAAVARQIDTAVPGVQALDRGTAVASIPGVSLIRQTFWLLIGMAFGINVVVVAFFFLILTVQKRRVFLAIRALGAPTRYLASSVLTQVVVVVTAGTAVATGILGLAAATASPSFPIRVAPGLAAGVLVAALVCCLAATTVPVRRIASLDPAVAARVP